MASLLINCSNLKNGGGLQVANSICTQLGKYQQHHFIVVLSTYIRQFEIPNGENCEIVRYNIKNNLATLLLGRDKFLDGLVKEYKVNAVLTVFGPSRWRPRCKHLCGFARAQLLLKNPLQRNLSIKERIAYRVWKWAFKNSSETFYTENKYISDLLPTLLGNVKVYTVTNYYNQVFDQQENWQSKVRLAAFDGVTMLTVSSTAVHKNLKIMIPISEYLEKHHPDFKFRFVLTCNETAMPVPDNIKNHFVYVGKVDVAECPNLYAQSDIMFMPTLVECFTATYPEAMRMNVPVVTTDLEFAHSLCGDAACYYSAINAEAAAEAIYKMATDKGYAARLVANGKKQLQKFDNYEQRVDKLVKILEKIAK